MVDDLIPWTSIIQQ